MKERSRGLISRGDFLKGAGAAGVAAGAGFLGPVAVADTGRGIYARPEETGWQPKRPPISTPWTDRVSPENVHPEYPRPQMVRREWLNLNGVWQFAAASEGEGPPVGRDLPERILVPFPVESALSGIMRHESRMFYRRRFLVPERWGIGRRGRRLLLHFDAVDYETKVWVNGHAVGGHRGGYDRFTFDVTDALRTGRSGHPEGEQELAVEVYDPTDDGGQPLGKQRLYALQSPGGIFYTPTSGIWQTVWMEPVPTTYIERLEMRPEVGSETLWLTVRARGSAGARVEATVYEGKRRVGSVTGPANRPLRLRVSDPRPWSPDDPFLYGLKVGLLEGRGGEYAADEVESYFGMRSVSLGKVGGRPHILINGEFIFQLGPLDQGFWPDGIYTAPTEDALRFDLEKTRELGYNMVRKHVKVEPDRWYYLADRLGLLVWQDMPSMPTGREPTPADQEEFLRELRRMVDGHRNHPSIVMWVPFNEGWGEFDAARVSRMVSGWDPSRLVDEMSGTNVCGCAGDDGDVLDLHNYVGPGPAPQPDDGRTSVVGEFGGLGLLVEGHLWTENGNHAYETETSPAQLTERYAGLLGQVERLEERCGLSAAVYTQTTDVETEINGLLTYDRKVLKPDAGRVREANHQVIAASGSVEKPQPPPPGTPGLTGVGFWPFEEGSGSSTADASGNGHTATLVNGPDWTDGRTGLALHFDGQNQWVDTGVSILDTTGNYSVAAWVLLDDRDGFHTAVSQDGENASEFFLQYSGADDRFAFSTVSGRALDREPPETGRWYHLVGVRDAFHSRIKLYVDGDLVGMIGYCPGEAAPGHTVIGRAKYGGQQVDFWSGRIDQVHVYDRALSTPEVRELYRSGR
ncbi:MAG: hypothetical protein K6T51_07700 [Rubrobacteraceae bacterium]|nr:glycoside hydrolase family 2 [Rubrobacteraceae bacterium]MCL6438480.1 hypothetical protein [Rubrobacteraceae bacterium]